MEQVRDTDAANGAGVLSRYGPQWRVFVGSELRAMVPVWRRRSNLHLRRRRQHAVLVRRLELLYLGRCVVGDVAVAASVLRVHVPDRHYLGMVAHAWPLAADPEAVGQHSLGPST